MSEQQKAEFVVVLEWLTEYGGTISREGGDREGVYSIRLYDPDTHEENWFGYVPDAVRWVHQQEAQL